MVDLKKLLASKKLRLVDLSIRLNVSQSTVTRWAQRRIPAHRVLEVEKLTRINRKHLRPDLYVG